MSVHPVIKQLEFLALSQLDEAEAGLVRAHLDDCPDCRQRYEECVANQAWEEELRAVIEPQTSVTVALCEDGSISRESLSLGTDAVEGYTLDFPPLGEGGQGVVYKAEQHFPPRKVAIKFLRGDAYRSTAARRRFEREILIAAKLRHPHIVAILDSGVLADGRRFCVMEYIRGQSLTDYVRSRNLSLAQMLELFAQVCDAVSHAHQRAIMHRDLKPSNILVDVEGQPKVVDFGLARMMAEPADRAVSVTGQVVGAPAYLSPEQTRGNPDEVDIRTDVYSLGIILYELLTGTYPYKIDGDWHELITQIREVEPTPPSSAWTVGSGVRPAGEIKARVRTQRIRCPVDQEIETIVLVCLRKDRERRYQSAGELARDIRHYLAGEPIEAEKDNLPYLLRKTLYRYRRPLAACVAAMIVLAVGLAMLVRQRARMAEQQAELDRSAARQIAAAFVNDPADALFQIARNHSQVKDQVVQLGRASVFSAAFTDRVAGARSSIVLDPEAFWKSVDGGPLWSNGEWLELASMDWPEPKLMFTSLKEKARSGTDRQKYVAFCLIGQKAAAGSELTGLCAQAAHAESHPGVVSAACWAATRLGNPVTFPRTPNLFPDDLAKTTFVLVPGCESFRRGSEAGDPDRYPDEARLEQGVRIKSFHLAVTEMSVAGLAAFLKDPTNAAFLKDPANADRLGPLAAAANADDALRELYQIMLVPAGEVLPQIAAGQVSLEVSRRYCQWLTDRAKSALPARRYRLPTENEWEYACRGGNEGRFCFGSNAGYLPFFANCNGARHSHVVGQRMPNWYGLFDMHGGLWEWCDSPYPPELIRDPELAGKDLLVKRGGAFYSPAVRCRSAQRNYATANAVDYYTGFRLVMEVAGP